MRPARRLARFPKAGHVRKPTEPGGFEPPGSVGIEDDIPTRPEGIDPVTLQLVRLFGDLNKVDRRRAAMLLENWSKCTLDRRVLIEALSRELKDQT